MTTSLRIPEAIRRALIVLAAAPVVLAAAARPAFGQVADNSIRSERWPHVDVTVAATFTHLGSRTIDLGAAEAEIHVFAETDGTAVERLYWIQFEGYPPGSGNQYDYSSQPHADTIGDFIFLSGARHGAYAASEIANEPDTRAVSEILGEHGYRFPAPMMRARMVTLDETSRHELLVIYMESLPRTGLTEAALAADTALWAKAAAGLRRRATAGLTLGRREAPGAAMDETPGGRIAARARQVADMFRAEPSGYDAFSDAFRAQVPDAALDQLFVGYHAEHGSVVLTEIIGPFAGGATVIRFRFADGAAAIMQFALESGAPHRIAGALLGPAFELDDEASSGGGGAIGELTYPTDTIVPLTRLHLPFRGDWTVFWGGRTLSQNYHRASSGQRYAYDLVVTRDGATHAGDGTANADYYCEGEPILAPAAGRVVRAVDGIAENTPGEMNPARLLGNHVVIEHREGEFSLLAHLQTGSVRVEVGDAVADGDPIGACGNSGNSSEPHLHYQLQDAADFGAARSIPAPFTSYRADGERVTTGEPVRGQVVAREAPGAG